MILTLSIALLFNSPVALQQAFTVKELAEYRLTDRVFAQFEQASRLIAEVTRTDPELTRAPLFTRDVTVAGDAPVVATELDARLQGHPRLTGALRTAGLTSHEYTKFALALLAARLAHGFISAGVLKRVPEGVASANVKFVGDHDAAIAAVLKDLGVEL